LCRGSQAFRRCGRLGAIGWLVREGRKETKKKKKEGKEEKV
jgi:hypothetical protein